VATPAGVAVIGDSDPGRSFGAAGNQPGSTAVS
jgi:hypothetical protein